MVALMPASAPRRRAATAASKEISASRLVRPNRTNPLADPVVAAHVDPGFPSGRLLRPRCGNPSSGTVLALGGYRKAPDSPNSRFLTEAIYPRCGE